MSIDAALHRIVRGHWILLLVLLIALPAGAVALTLNKDPVYAAQSRIQVGTSLPSSQTEADGVSARALGLATSPGIVDRALAEAAISADTRGFAAEHIDVSRIGASAIVTLTVTWVDPDQAAAVAMSLTDQVLAFSNDAGYSAATDRVQDLDDSISSLEASREALIPRLGTASPGDVRQLQAQLDGITTTLQEDLRQRSELIVAAASRSTSVLVDPVQTPSSPGPAPVLEQAALGVLVALLSGLAIAATLETVRPRWRGLAAIASALQTTPLGELDARTQITQRGLHPLLERIEMLAHAGGISRVLLLPVVEQDQQKSGLLDTMLHAIAAGPAGASWLSYALLGGGHDDSSEAGVVVLSPRVATGRALTATRDVLALLDKPLLGVITYHCDAASWGVLYATSEADDLKTLQEP
ncbi:MAG: hypothetical protein WA962_05460 [Ornithinimicrobium sp.]